MTLDPRERKSWQGFLDLLQPPAGYRLSAALGTSFGLSIDALTAALLTMSDTDGEALAGEPVAGVMAITRLRSKVRVLVHPGTISGSPHAGSRRFVALLDRMVVEVQADTGLFHPKVWALRFDRVVGASAALPETLGRVVVASRNLSTSTSFEIGAVFEGPVASGRDAASPLAVDVAAALQAWMSTGKVRVPEVVWQLPRFVRRLALDIPHEAQDGLRLRWQGPDRKPLVTFIPARLERALVVSPFVRSDFVSALVERTQHLQLVSTPEALDALDDATHARLDARREAQGSPVLYQVSELTDPEDLADGNIQGLHAKLLLTEDARQTSATFVGSANATGPGWGLGAPANVEAMAEMRPGIGIDRFVAGFIRESKTKVHPWVIEYDRANKAEPDSTDKTARQMLTALRDVASLNLRVDYDADRQRLTLGRLADRALSILNRESNIGLTFEIAPLLLTERPGAWTPVESLARAAREFDDVPVQEVTAFVAVRARSKSPPLERTRLLLARLNLSEAALDQRDDAVRQKIMATADPAAVLAALVRGLAYLRAGQPGEGPPPIERADSIHRLLGETHLEGLLQAVAAEPGLIAEMRLLLAPTGGTEFGRLCDDLDVVARQLRLGVTP